MTNLQAEELPREASDRSTAAGALELAPTGNLLITLALEPAEAERLVFAAEHGSVWLAAEGSEVSEADTVVQTRRTVYEAAMSLVVVAAVDTAFEQRVRGVLPRPFTDTVQRWEGSLADAEELKAVADRSPAVVILGPDLGEDDAFDRARRFDRFYPAICVLVVADPGPNTWRRALAAGVRGVIAPGATDDELRTPSRRGPRDRPPAGGGRRRPSPRPPGPA